MTKIQAPNYTQIPNIVIDYWSSVLTPAEFKVLIFICRKTFGFQKKSDKISLSQIMKANKLSDRGALNCIETLEKKHKLLKVKRKKKPGRNDMNTYSLVISDKVVPAEKENKKRVNSVTEENKKRVNSVLEKGELSSYTKETLTKENTQQAKNSHKSEIYDGSTILKKEKSIKSKKIDKAESGAFRLAEMLREYIDEWGGRISNSSNLDTWSGDIDKILKIDGYTKEEVRDVIYWFSCKEPGSNGFCWRNQILSGRNLRSKFDLLFNAMKSEV